MGLFSKIKRHAAVAGANFGAMFKGVEIPPLPVALERLIGEMNNPEPDIDKLELLISSETGLAAKVIQTANSSLFGLRVPVADVKRAVVVLGLENIRSIALAYMTMGALPKPKGKLFKHQAFWTDSLLRAILSHAFAQKMFRQQAEEAFTAALLADITLPILLSNWQEYYRPVIVQWDQETQRLSQLEQAHFGWDHAQAGAWIAQSWGFPEQTVFLIGAHNLPLDTLQDHEVEDTLVKPLAVASLTPSVLNPDDTRARMLVQGTVEELELIPEEFRQILDQTKSAVHEILDIFGLSSGGADQVLSLIQNAIEPQTPDKTS